MSDQPETGGLSGAGQSILCTLIVVPLGQAALQAVLRAVNSESTFAVVGGVAMATVCGVYAFGPKRWLADPDIAGRFGRDYSVAARLICGTGVLMGLTLVVLSFLN